MKKFSVILFVFLSLLIMGFVACEDDDPLDPEVCIYTLDCAATGEDVESCCTSTDCRYVTGEKSFECDGQDCDAAATLMADYCVE